MQISVACQVVSTTTQVWISPIFRTACATREKTTTVVQLYIQWHFIYSICTSGFVQKSDCGFPNFSRTKLHLFSRLFKAFCSSLCEQKHYKIGIECQNFLYNVFFYSTYRMWLKFFNFELQMLCVMNRKKINKCMGNQQCNRHLHFPGQHYSFQGFFQTFPYLWSFSRLFKALKVSTLNSRTFHTFPGSVQTLVQCWARQPFMLTSIHARFVLLVAVCPSWHAAKVLH